METLQETDAAFCLVGHFRDSLSKEPSAGRICMHREPEDCPAAIQQYTTCTGGTCTVKIPGYFKMRTRFADFTGEFVNHCHILAHEDRGMMQLIEVIPRAKNLFRHR